MPNGPSIPVFDIGGVLLDWNPRYLYRKLIDDEAEMEAFLAVVCSPEWNLSIDRGKPLAEAVEERSALFPDQADLIRAYRSRWQEMVPRALDDTVDLLHALKQRGGPVYAITNFGAETFAMERRRWRFLDVFDDIVVSAEIGEVKPDAAIYERLLARNGLAASDCLFIDDVERNVDGARAVGMAAIQFRCAGKLQKVLTAYGML